MNQANSDTNSDTNINLLRALDGILLGGLFLMILILMQLWLPTPPLLIAKFLYIIPLFIICRAVFKIPSTAYPNRAWKIVLKRIRFFSAATVALSPFWAWWKNFPYNPYLRINVVLLALAAMLTIYNFVNLSIISKKKNPQTFMLIFSRITRFAILYIIIAPFITFIIAAYYTENYSWSIIILFLTYKKIIISIAILPVFMTAFILMRWRKK